MRVIAGRYKGRKLGAPDWQGLRPTSDRLKETLFAIVAQSVVGARVLDGFAGSGALGIEALSRGAASVVFVDQDPRAAGLIHANLRHCGITTGYTMVRDGFVETMHRASDPQPYDLVLLDPPYDHDDLATVLASVAVRLSATGTLILEHARRTSVPERVATIIRYRTVTAGDSALSFYRTAAAHDPHSVEAR